ncbi:NAD(P)/FAD-dependent oxidoreductase [Pedobacter aquatilis]|uniref:NAD(P)/FAD-dependent oxidoreductase n=1 Tax=Pedobacter aquatilis TaxID=351343 RepID=UPI0025B36163|nr:NAD(P)/FAD-dependent oxidoreductase [Pedobacter aquatilis]MDN3585627.1 NAD(P)/FAD-dependent oxidoreductase [Pedobacter aquatilis]
MTIIKLPLLSKKYKILLRIPEMPPNKAEDKVLSCCMPIETEILIIGGGLAGLTAALHLQKLGFDVILIEKHTYPHHKVCGEYISNEILPYYNWLGLNLSNLEPNQIRQLQFTSTNGKNVTANLPLGGFGLSRFAIDDYLYRTALERGIKIQQATVQNVTYTTSQFFIDTTEGETFSATQVVGAYGKRSALDAKLERNFISRKSPYLAVKAHYKSNFPNNLVSLNNFKGGYCGVSNVEKNTLNICYLTDYESFKKHKNIDAFQKTVLYQNKHLERYFTQSEMIFEAPLTISQISFETKEPVLNHILMIGDTAGLIHPLCGNGMAMAIHSAKILAESLHQFKLGKISSRQELENSYMHEWKKLFARRLQIGKLLASIMKNNRFENIAMSAASYFPGLIQKTVKYTHGKPITIPDI